MKASCGDENSGESTLAETVTDTALKFKCSEAGLQEIMGFVAAGSEGRWEPRNWPECDLECKVKSKLASNQSGKELRSNYNKTF